MPHTHDSLVLCCERRSHTSLSGRWSPWVGVWQWWWWQQCREWVWRADSSSKGSGGWCRELRPPGHTGSPTLDPACSIPTRCCVLLPAKGKSSNSNLVLGKRFHSQAVFYVNIQCLNSSELTFMHAKLCHSSPFCQIWRWWLCLRSIHLWEQAGGSKEGLGQSLAYLAVNNIKNI